MAKTVIAAMATLLLLATVTYADGIMMPEEKAAALQRMEQALINEPEQKAAIFFSNGVEQLIISPSYEGSAERFAWVVPVPAKPQVEVADAALFHDLMDITKTMIMAVEPAIGTLAEDSVKVIERKTVGDYDVSVLSSTEGNALMKWLSSNGYHLPAKAADPIQYYVGKRWTFVACRVKDPSASAQGLRTGTLAPLSMTFASKRPIYPLRLSSANPKPFTLLVYLIVPPDTNGGVKIVTLDAPPPTAYGPRCDFSDRHTLGPESDGYPAVPALRKLAPCDSVVWAAVHPYNAPEVRPEQCTHDLAWSIHAFPRPASARDPFLRWRDRESLEPVPGDKYWYMLF